MRLSKIVAAVPAIAMLAFAGLAPNHAEAQAQGPVTVNIDPTVGNLIALDLDVDISQIPVTVQAPIGIAANVCNIGANVLATDVRQGGAACEAENTSRAFSNLVQRNLVQN